MHSLYCIIYEALYTLNSYYHFFSGVHYCKERFFLEYDTIELFIRTSNLSNSYSWKLLSWKLIDKRKPHQQVTSNIVIWPSASTQNSCSLPARSTVDHLQALPSSYFVQQAKQWFDYKPTNCASAHTINEYACVENTITVGSTRLVIKEQCLSHLQQTARESIMDSSQMLFCLFLVCLLAQGSLSSDAEDPTLNISKFIFFCLITYINYYLAQPLMHANPISQLLFYDYN